MYLNNLTGKTIKDISFEGFMFSIPAGVSMAWDKFGEWLLKDIYPMPAEGTVLPPVVQATAKAWGGQRYVDVVRFPLNPSLIGKRPNLLKLAKERGIDPETLQLWTEDESIDNGEIAKAINELDVPDVIKYPAPAGDQPAEDAGDDDADKILEDAAGDGDQKGTEPAKTDAGDANTAKGATDAPPAGSDAPAANQTQKAPTTKGGGTKGGKSKGGTKKVAKGAPKTSKAGAKK